MEYNNSFEDEVSKVSKINSAGLINVTTEGLWKDCYRAMEHRDFYSWNTKLDSLWLIFGGDVVEGSKDELEFNSLQTMIYNTGSLIHKSAGFQGISAEETKTISLQYQLLMKKSIFLRRLQNAQGKGTAYSQGSEDDFE